MNNTLPLSVHSSSWRYGHVQGIAIDKERKYMYYSFTTALIKTDLAGNVIGSVVNLLGHLGCIAMNNEDGCVYGSLEYKHDAIGKGIMNRLGLDLDLEDAFYMAIFDVSKIDRLDMDAEKDGIMTCVYLKQVVDDFNAKLPREHRHGCSGIDGTTFGPKFGCAPDSKQYLTVAYGIYLDNERTDNDYQVLLQYDISDWAKYRRPINQYAMHHEGPEAPDGKYFVFTGNTSWGVQNLEYDAWKNVWFLTVYLGRKDIYPNYPMYIVDNSMAPVEKKLQGYEDGTVGPVLTLLATGETRHPSGVPGYYFPWGQTGFIALGDGKYYVSHNCKDENGWNSTVHLYHWDESGETPLLMD